MELGQKLKHFRQEKGLTQLELSEKMGVSRQTLSNWENSRTLPDGQSLLYLADAYEVSLDELLDRPKITVRPVKKPILPLLSSLIVVILACLAQVTVFGIEVLPLILLGMLLFFILRDFLHH